MPIIHPFKTRISLNFVFSIGLWVIVGVKYESNSFGFDFVTLIFVKGLFESADGKDQESTSEEINYHYGVTLWGLATQSSTIESLGRLMLAVAKRSIQTYFLMSADNQVMPKEFIGNKVTGIFFDNKADYTTWFGGNPEYIHGIQ